jgi:metal-sulfur cluster biosynthetic enzyme
LKERVWQVLHQVRDEQLYQTDLSIVDLGYVYDVRIRGAVVTVVVTLPHRGRPVHEFLESAGGGRVDSGIRERLLSLPEVRKVLVKRTWNPPWSIARLSPRARREMGVED